MDMKWSPKKKEYGVGILMAPDVKLEAYKERIISAKLRGKNLRLVIINVYAPTDATQSESTKNALSTALNKANKELDHIPSYKSV